MKKTIVRLLALITLLALAACNNGDPITTPSESTAVPTDPTGFMAQAPLRVTNDRVSSEHDSWDLSISLSFPDRSAEPLLPILESITEKSGGKVTFTMYYSWSLFNVEDAVQRTAGGVADIATLPPHEYPGVFKINTVTSGLPLVGWPDNTDATMIYSELCQTYPELVDEFTDNGLTLWGSYYMPPYNIYQTGNDPIILPKDLEGCKLITASSDVQDLVRANGGTPIASPVPSYAADLGSGAADSVLAHLNVLGAFGVVPDLINSRTIFGDGGLLMYNLAFVFSTKTWESLPGDIQQLFVDEYENLITNMANGDTGLLNFFEGRLAEKGIETYVLSDEEIDRWNEQIAPFHNTLIGSLESEGFSNAQAIYDSLLERIDFYKTNNSK